MFSFQAYGVLHHKSKAIIPHKIPSCRNTGTIPSFYIIVGESYKKDLGIKSFKYQSKENFKHLSLWVIAMKTT